MNANQRKRGDASWLGCIRVHSRSLAALVTLALGILGAVEVDPQKYLAHVKYLASEDLKGRGSGTPGLDKAAEYIARQFRALGLKPVPGHDYFQPFKVTTNARLGKNNRLEYAAGDQKASIHFDRDFRPFNFSASGSAGGQVVFAGYGITASEYN